MASMAVNPRPRRFPIPILFKKLMVVSTVRIVIPGILMSRPALTCPKAINNIEIQRGLSKE
jgi:hypothetical protein